MHFRVRKNVIQLLRVTYDPNKKKGFNTLIGTVKLADPVLSDEIVSLMTEQEIADFNLWLTTKYHLDTLREELAALTLSEQIELAEKWFEREGNSHRAQILANSIFSQWQSLRRQMLKSNLID